MPIAVEAAAQLNYMIIVKKSKQLSEYIVLQKAKGLTIGFVPTMGALHQGHISLLTNAKKQNDITVCSIFVNPTQFNNAEDFRNYPITIAKDIERLIKEECEVLFLPSTSEIYPADYQKRHYDLGTLESMLEGYYRPGHFQGVCQVVDRLLEIVQPDNLYMGQKDFQQCMVVKKLLQLTGRQSINLHIEPTIREDNGLAMSSRNLRLDKKQRQASLTISRTLNRIKQDLDNRPLEDLKREAKEELEQNGFVVDYVEIADANSLQPAQSKGQNLVALIAASIGGIRLIDNMLLNGYH